MFSPNGAPNEPKRTLGAQYYNGVTKGQENMLVGIFFFFEKKVFWKKYKHAKTTILRLRSRRPSSQPRTFAS